MATVCRHLHLRNRFAGSAESLPRVKEMPWMAQLAGAKASVFFCEKIPQKFLRRKISPLSFDWITARMGTVCFIHQERNSCHVH
jgi:hypothetical protein